MMTIKVPEFLLTLYLVTVVSITFCHRPAILATVLVLAVMLCGPKRWRLLRRALVSVLTFNLTISLGYTLIAYWQHTFQADYLILINLRVVLLVFLGFWFIDAVPILMAVRRWPKVRWLVTLAIGQIRTFERVVQDFRLAFASRNMTRPRTLARLRSATAQTQTLLDKSVASASDAALAMRSRGAFDD